MPFGIYEHKNQGKNHYRWLGIRAGLRGKHLWITRNYGKPNKCENPDCKYPRTRSSGVVLHKPGMYHWANISTKYEREITDYVQLCASCHRRWDMGLITIKINGKCVKHKKYSGLN